jgi:hypothetical protein
MTAFAMDVRELSFDEIDQVSGAGDAEDITKGVVGGIIAAAILGSPVGIAIVGVALVGAVLFYPTPAH